MAPDTFSPVTGWDQGSSTLYPQISPTSPRSHGTRRCGCARHDVAAPGELGGSSPSGTLTEPRAWEAPACYRPASSRTSAASIRAQ